MMSGPRDPRPPANRSDGRLAGAAECGLRRPLARALLAGRAEIGERNRASEGSADDQRVDRWLLSAVLAQLASAVGAESAPEWLFSYQLAPGRAATLALEDVRATSARLLAAGVPAADVLCAAYEQIVDLRCATAAAEQALAEQPAVHERGRRRRAGAYFTPPDLVDLLVESTLAPYLLDDLDLSDTRLPRAAIKPDLCVLDLACGSGRFLLGVIRRLAADWQAPVGTLIRYVFGVDADPLAVDASRAALWLEAGGTPSNAALARSIRWGDAIAGPVVSAGVPPNACTTAGAVAASAAPPVDWTADFPEAMRLGGFDVVLGNPPFANAIEQPTRRSAAQRALFRLRYPGIAAGAYDLSTLFVARAAELLRPGGRYGLVCPRSIASATGSARLRAFLADHARPDVIWCPDEAEIFAGASIFVCIIAGGRGRLGTNVRVSTAPAAGSFRIVEWPTEPSFERWWELVTIDRAIGTAPAGTLPTLGAVAEIWAGTSTALAYEIALGVVDEVAGDGPKLLTTGAIDRFECHWGARRQRYLGRDYEYPRWPAAAGSVADERARARQARPKLLVAGLSRVVEGCLDDVGDLAGVVATLVVVPHAADRRSRLAMLAVLNSPVFSYAYLTRYGARSLAGGNCPIGKREIGTIAVPFDSTGQPRSDLGILPEAWYDALGLPDGRPERLWDRIAELAERLVGRLQDQERARLDELLRAMVSAAYGLSPAQHRMVDAWWHARRKRGLARPATAGETDTSGSPTIESGAAAPSAVDLKGEPA